MKLKLLILLGLLMCSCASENPLDTILQSESPKISSVINQLEKHEVQILYTQIDRNSKNEVYFTDYEFNVSDSTYFYPASSVKFPIAVMALEKLNKLKGNGIPIDKKTKFSVNQGNLYSSIENDIIQIFSVSDNAAYNRLFEFLGQDYINHNLASKEISGRISHRLSTSNADAHKTQPIIFKNRITDSLSIYSQEIIFNSTPSKLDLTNISKGKGYYENDSLIRQPKDFSKKNYLPLRSLHELMKRVQFPEVYDKKKSFNISETDHNFLIKTMKLLPYETGYDRTKYYDGYVKFFMFGDTKDDIPQHIEIYNKVGYAYGYLTDCAYIKDSKNNIEFLLSATIHVNENEIFNDDQYEYDEIGIPFLAELGRKVYTLELERKK